MITRSQRCPNQNHLRRDAPVRNCPQCGGVVNESLPLPSCADAEHGEQRRRQGLFCVHCGEQLRVAAP